MGEIRQLFDTKQYPLRYGTLTDLEKHVMEMERRFSEIYPSTQGSGYPVFCTAQGTRFYANAIYEWKTVFLEYVDDSEDGDMVSLEYDEDSMFSELHQEILAGELDDRMALEYTYRIYKTEVHEGNTSVFFRYWDGKNGIRNLTCRFSHVTIDDITCHYRELQGHQAVVIETVIESDLYDHWIRFEP